MEDLERTRKEQEAELKKIKERERKAGQIVQRKFEAVAKTDSRFEGYRFADKAAPLPARTERKDGTITGFVFPYSKIWSGVVVELYGEDGSFYYGTTDERGQSSIIAPPGDYDMVINHPGHKPLMKQITIRSGGMDLLNQIRLEKLD